MKKMPILVLFLGLFLNAQSQIVEKANPRTKNSIKQNKNGDRYIPIKKDAESNPSHHKPGKYIMQPDNMVCIVPDMNLQARMPNGFNRRTPIPHIPNALQGKRLPKEEENK